MRGLKPEGKILQKEDRVASFTDAWIETNMSIEFNNGLESHLLQMRGLKQNKERNYCSAVSHLLQMRGLKQYIQPGPSLTEVASFTDAWIETRRRNEH